MNRFLSAILLMTISLPACAGIFTRPTFSNCTVTLTPAVEGAVVEYRRAGGRWKEFPDFRGSLLGLEEDSAYEVRFKKDGKVIDKAIFRTWKSDVGVGKTVEIDPQGFEAPYIINEKGSPDAWVRYVVRGGLLDNPTDRPTFIVDGAEYVLIDGMTLRGARNSTHAILVRSGRAIRIRNCDIAGWGREGKQNFQRLPYENRFGPGNGSYVDRDGHPINLDPAIDIRKGASEVVVERCFIHDPVSRSVSWYYHHPEGPNAIAVAGPEHSTVIRWNDFIGSDRHRWNDAVEGPGNFSTTGGIRCDSDVYGNFMIFANDDCIELDGGQQNIRCYGNRFEGALTGVSVQGCMVGPSLVYDNWFTGMCEEFGMYGQTVKTGGGRHGEHSYSYIWGNTFWGAGAGIMERANLGTVVTDNRFCGAQTLKKSSGSVRSSDSGNEYGVIIDESEIDVRYPLRPLDFTLGRARITIGRSRAPLEIKINGTLPEGCVIRKPDVFDWFDVEIGEDRLTVTFDDAKMKSARHYRGAFILRTPDGLSRPVSIYAETDYIPPFKVEKPGIYVQYIDFSLSPGEKKSVSFDIEKAGRYWIMVHGTGRADVKTFEKRGSWPHPLARVDGQPFKPVAENMFAYPSWAMLNPGGDIYSFVTHFDFEAGRHTLDVDATSDKSVWHFDGLAVTDDPSAFEPNRID